MGSESPSEKIKIRSLPLEERIRLYNKAIDLHKKYGWGYVRISKKLSVPIDVVRHWLYHGRIPIRQGHPHLFEPTPSPELAYVIGVVLGDGNLSQRKKSGERSGRVIRLRARDKEFVEKFALAMSKLLRKRKPYKVVFENNQYRVYGYSFYLFEFLKKQFDTLKPFIEAYPTEFIKGVVDSEGSVKISVWRWKTYRTLTINVAITNTNLELLLYVHELLRKHLGIESIIKPSYKAGSKFWRNGKEFTRKKDVYDLVITKLNDVKLFASRVGFSIKRKHQKLLDAIRICEDFKSGEERTEAWLKLYKKKNGRWTRIK